MAQVEDDLSSCQSSIACLFEAVQRLTNACSELQTEYRNERRHDNTIPEQSISRLQCHNSYLAYEIRRLKAPRTLCSRTFHTYQVNQKRYLEYGIDSSTMHTVSESIFSHGSVNAIMATSQEARACGLEMRLLYLGLFRYFEDSTTGRQRIANPRKLYLKLELDTLWLKDCRGLPKRRSSFIVHTAKHQCLIPR